MITPQCLREVPLFAGLDEALLGAVAAESADVRLNAGEYLIREGLCTGHLAFKSRLAREMACSAA